MITETLKRTNLPATGKTGSRKGEGGGEGEDLRMVKSSSTQLLRVRWKKAGNCFTSDNPSHEGGGAMRL